MRRALLLWLLLATADVRAWALDWRCWLLHWCKPVESPNPRDLNRYWECDCDRRICKRARDRSTAHTFVARGRPPDAQWLDGGDWRPRLKPPTAPPPPKPRGLDYSDLEKMVRDARLKDSE